MNGDRITIDNVSRFYGEVLGVNRITLSIPPGITSLVGPNGSGKTTLMNMMTGLVRPTEGTIRILGVDPRDARQMFHFVGYSTQFDSFPKGATGRQFDPLVRAETINLFRQYAADGRHVIVSTHILHEVDMISDQFILLSNGYVVAEGQIQDVRSEISEHPMQVTIRCKQPGALASKVFELDHVVEARIHPDGEGVLVLTRDADKFYRMLNHIALSDLDIESIAPADDTVKSVYEYLIGEESQR